MKSDLLNVKSIPTVNKQTPNVRMVCNPTFPASELAIGEPIIPKP